MIFLDVVLAESGVLVASTNPGKIREIRRVLRGAPVRLITLPDLSPVPEPDETGATFADNALLKARHYAVATGLPTVAEDSGLVIDVLDGRPGVHSARYPGTTYLDKFANLNRELAGHPRPWHARFVCALACVDPAHAPGEPSESRESRGKARGTTLFTIETTVEGEVLPAPRGTNGFGYDPIFFYPPYGKTLGEATDDEKLAVSHRGQAFRAFAAWLRARA
jgi:XTP/dITP diphosphohydrolase